MSTKSENSDSDSNNSSSWVLLDDIKNGENKPTEMDEAEDNKPEEQEDESTRQAVEDIIENDSDGISVLTDPEEINFEYPTTDLEEKEVQKEAEQIVTYKKHEVVKVDLKYLISSSTLTSASFVVLGLLIALYFKDGFEDEVVTDSKYKAYNPIKLKDFNDYNLKHVRDIEYIPDNSYATGKKRKVYSENKYKYENQRDYKTYPKNRKNSMDMITIYRQKSKGDKFSNSNKKKGEFKIYREDRYKVDGNQINKISKGKEYERIDYKYDAEKKLKEQGEYLNKKQHYLKHKEEKLKRKELKIHLKNVYDTSKNFKSEKKINKTSGDWYLNSHNARQKLRKGEKEGDWMFARVELRKKKRDKARWYFDIMDERKTEPYKKNS